jgi:hypothetical protein
MCVAFSPIAKSESGGRDGNWWNDLSENQKLTFAVGFFDGLSYESKLAGYINLLAQDDPKTKTWSPQRAKVLVEFAKQTDSALQHDFGNVTSSQLVTGLDKIYSDYRNMRIAPLEALPVVVRSINGASDEQINKLLEQKRKEAAN